MAENSRTAQALGINLKENLQDRGRSSDEKHFSTTLGSFEFLLFSTTKVSLLLHLLHDLFASRKKRTQDCFTLRNQVNWIVVVRFCSTKFKTPTIRHRAVPNTFAYFCNSITRKRVGILKKFFKKKNKLWKLDRWLHALECHRIEFIGRKFLTFNQTNGRFTSSVSNRWPASSPSSFFPHRTGDTRERSSKAN